MQDIRLIGLDLDGTVFDDAKHISPRNLAAIEAAVQAGIIVLPATGRTATGVPQAFTSIPGVHYALTSNGASVVDMRTGEHIVDQPFSLEDSLRVYDALKPFGGVFSLFVGGKSYATRADNDLIDVLVPENLRDYFRKTRIEVPDLRTVLQEKVGQVEKIQRHVPQSGAAGRGLARRAGRLPGRRGHHQPGQQHRTERPRRYQGQRPAGPGRKAGSAP